MIYFKACTFSLKSCQLASDIYLGGGKVLPSLLIKDSDLVKHPFKLRANM